MEVARRTSTDTRFQVTLAEHLQVARFVPAAHGTDIIPCLSLTVRILFPSSTSPGVAWQGKLMAADEALNVLFYVPSRKDFLGNGLIFVCAVLLAGGFHYLPIDPANLAGLVYDPASTLGRSLFLAGIAFLANYLIVFFAVDKYFLNWRQSASASIGTTIAVCIAYSSVWGVYHLQHLQGRTLLHLFKTHWRPLVQALRAGAVLSCLSSVPLKAWTYRGNQEFLEFTPLRKAACEWKELAAKIEKSQFLSTADHGRMKTLVKSMIDALAGIGVRQPITRRPSGRLKTALDRFDAWYLHETRFGPGNLKGFDSSIEDAVQ